MRAAGARAKILREFLLKRRKSPVVDLLLGLCILVPAAAWAAKVSPVLAAAVFLVPAGVYLAGFLGARRTPESTDAASATASALTIREALTELEGKIDRAPAVPLTGMARIETADVEPLLRKVRSAARLTDGDDVAEELEEIIVRGPRLPLTDQRQIDKERAQKLLHALREQLL